MLSEYSVFLEEWRSSCNDPAGQDRYDQSTGIYIMCLPVTDRTDQREAEDLRYKQDQQGHERSAEGTAEEKISTRRDVHEERDVFDQGDDQNTTGH